MSLAPAGLVIPRVERDFLIEVQKGNVPGHSMVHKFGRNDAVPNGSWAFINQLGFTGWPLSAATTVRVKAGDVADTSGGAGAREITVQGIDSNFAELSEAIATNGTSASTSTTASFWRVHKAWVSAAGTYGAANTADVIIENTAGNTDLIQITIDEGQTQFLGWTTPLGKTAYLLSASATVNTGANKTADVRMFTRAAIDDTSAPMESKRIRLHWDGVVGDIEHVSKGPEFSISEKTDIWMEAFGEAVTQISGEFELLVVDD